MSMWWWDKLFKDRVYPQGVICLCAWAETSYSKNVRVSSSCPVHGPDPKLIKRVDLNGVERPL